MGLASPLAVPATHPNAATTAISVKMERVFRTSVPTKPVAHKKSVAPAMVHASNPVMASPAPQANSAKKASVLPIHAQPTPAKQTKSATPVTVTTPNVSKTHAAQRRVVLVASATKASASMTHAAK
jgi:hypothetical protein